LKLAVNFNEIAIGVAEVGCAGLPDWSIHRSGDLFSTALDEIGIGGRRRRSSCVGHQDGASAPTHHPSSPRPYVRWD